MGFSTLRKKADFFLLYSSESEAATSYHLRLTQRQIPA